MGRQCPGAKRGTNGTLGINFLGRFQMNRNNDQMLLEKRV